MNKAKDQEEIQSFC